MPPACPLQNKDLYFWGLDGAQGRDRTTDPAIFSHDIGEAVTLPLMLPRSKRLICKIDRIYTKIL